MKKSLLILLAISCASIKLSAQDIIQVPIGASYANQVYYSFSNDEMHTVGNNTWDLAFAITSSFEAGIHVNESVNLSFTGPSPKTLLYKAPTNDFNTVIDVSEIGDSLYNSEISWGIGAVNEPRDTLNPADFGWGVFNTDSHTVEGNRVFVIQLRDGSYRKFMVESLIGGVYTLKYANLDGSDENTVTINKADFEDTHLILFSFLNGATLETMPKKWDLVFERYSELDPSHTGVIVEYTVTGILTAPGVLTIQVDEADPENINFDDYKDNFESALNVIGQDWKFFSFDTGWNIIDDRVFFVKTADNHLWQMYIYDFEGSSTGIYTFGKWDLGVLAKVENLNSSFESFTVVPNPVNTGEAFSMVIESKVSQGAKLSLINLNGQQIYTVEKDFNQGLNAVKIPAQEINSGIYLIMLESSTGRIVRKVILK